VTTILSRFGSRANREKKVLANQQYYRSLIDFKPEAVFLADLDGDILLLNKPCEQLSGFTEEECKMYTVRELFFSLKDEPNPFNTAQIRDFSANMFLLEANSYLLPVHVDLKEIEGSKFLCILKPEKQSKLTEKPDNPIHRNEDKPFQGDPLVIEHNDDNAHAKKYPEFEHIARNALNTVLGYTSVLAKDTTVIHDKKLKKYVDTILKSSNNLKKIFNTYNQSNIESDDMVWTDTSVMQVLQKANIMHSTLARQQNVAVEISEHKDLIVLSDELILLNILGYLIEKAILYTRSDNVNIDFSVKEDQSEFMITIDNIGQDIPSAVIHFIRRENIKDRYDYKNPVLANNPEIQTLLKNLNSLDAKIEFVTGESQGEIAHLKFPMPKNLELQDESFESLPEIQVNERKLHALIVEDEKINANILKLFIEKFVNVSIAYSGNEAMNIIEMNFNKGILFNIVFMDIGLPEPWDGILLKNSILKKWPEYQNLPFIAQTAYANQSIAERIRQEDFKGYLIKPLNRHDVLRFIDKILK